MKLLMLSILSTAGLGLVACKVDAEQTRVRAAALEQVAVNAEYMDAGAATQVAPEGLQMASVHAPVAESPAAELERLRAVADTIVVFSAAAATSFADPADPTRIYTRYSVTTHQRLKGKEPLEIDLPGGTIGSLRVRGTHGLLPIPNQRYVGFFKNHNNQTLLIRGSEVQSDTHFVLRGVQFPIAELAGGTPEEH